ncbi:MAG TPA: Rad52/Rad22 family DNA repair protein [Gemmatimonadales bacterium]|nr:Rad52/Rad22 family DNA repair protein [Gemmatimonadales bacterium]
MMTQHPDLFAALAAPFEPEEVKVRSQSGRQLNYVTARTIMNRLDNVLGPENWWDEYVPNANSVLCRLSIRLPDGSVLTKCDAGGYAGMADSGDDDKSGYSDSFKRAAVKFGVARYLYRDGVPKFVQERIGVERTSVSAEDLTVTRAAEAPARNGTNGHHKANGKWGGPGNGPTANGHASEPPAASNGKGDGVPRSGKALFGWVKDAEQRHQVGLLKYLNSWAKLQEFPGRMIDWDADQVSLAYAEATRKLAAIQAASDPVYASQEGPE